jgi:flavodoxin
VLECWQISKPELKEKNMDPVTIATIASGVVSALAPFFKKGGEKIADKIAEEGFDQRGKIWETVKGVFLGDDLTTLHLLEKYPENNDIQNEVKTKLEEKLTTKPAIAKELEEMLKALPVSQIKHNTINITGDGNNAVQDNSGTVNINR